jgi:hypothetical protein
MGRLTLPELFGVETGWVVLGVVLMALFMFWGGEQLERIIGGKDLSTEPRWRYYGAGALVVGALFILVIGQPTTVDRWKMVEAEMQPKLDNRDVYIHPGELLDTLHDHSLQVRVIDVRNEADYNLFHLAEAERADLSDVPDIGKELLLAPPNMVVVVMSNDEAVATEAWKALAAESVPNIYILEGGINGWLTVFRDEELGIEPRKDTVANEELGYEFVAALGGSYEASDPSYFHWHGLIEYIPKIKLELKRGPTSGGCG